MEHSHMGHRKRLKNRIVNYGLDSFEPHNVLELLLFYALPQGDTNGLAHDLIQEFGSLSAVFDAPYESLMKVKGVKEHTATLIKFIPEITRYYLNDKTSDVEILDSPEKVGKFFVAKFFGKTNEVVYAAALDNKYRLLNCTPLFEGTVNAANITIKKIVDFAMKSNSSILVIAHNHPYSTALPSKDDIVTTRRIREALAAVEIKLIDHIIVADDDYISLAQSGEFSNIFDKS